VKDDLQTDRGHLTGSIFSFGNIALLVAVIVLGWAVYFTPLKGWLADGQLIKGHLDLLGAAAPVAFTLGTALLASVGTPRLMLCTVGGMAFGFAWGLAWTQLGTLLGSYATFLFIRWRGKNYALCRFPRLRNFAQGLENNGLISVILFCQLPLNGFYNNVLLGLTPVSHFHFLVGSLLGFLPMGITACLLGAGLIQRDLLKCVQYIGLGLACSAILGFVLNYLIRKSGISRNLGHG